MQALESGDCSIVEGIVHVLHKERYSGHDKGEEIRIGDRQFVYSYFAFTEAYKCTISHGGKV